MPKVNDFDLFPVLIRSIEGFLTEAECAEIVSKLDLGALGPHGSLVGDARSSFEPGLKASRNVLDEIERYLKIKDRIFYQINVYARDFGTRPVRLDNSWINVQREGSKLSFHTHPLSIVSGALYLKVDKDSSKTTFCNPNPLVDMMPVLQPTNYTLKTASVAPALGSLLLFPSWLKHGALDRNRSVERVVLSFNTAFYADFPERWAPAEQ